MGVRHGSPLAGPCRRRRRRRRRLASQRSRCVLFRVPCSCVCVAVVLSSSAPASGALRRAPLSRRRSLDRSAPPPPSPISFLVLFPLARPRARRERRKRRSTPPPFSPPEKSVFIAKEKESREIRAVAHSLLISADFYSFAQRTTDPPTRHSKNLRGHLGTCTNRVLTGAEAVRLCNPLEGESGKRGGRC